tara:strand:+ start:68593 stop:70071 length:1479 start_codon:yes stop_codon:yes gene_type:complete
MGVIQKQAIRTTAITFIGIGVGLLSNIIKPLVLSKEQLGAIGLLDTTSQLFATIFCLGFPQISFRMFPLFRNEKKGHSGYFLFGIFLSLVGIVFAELSFFLTESWVLGDDPNSAAIRMIAHFIIPMIFFRILFKNLDIYMSMMMNSVLGSFLEAFLLKFVIFIGFVIFWLDWIDYEYFVYIYVAAFILPGLIIVIFSFIKSSPLVMPKKALFENDKRKDMIRYGSYGVFASLASILVLSIDQLMINGMLGTEATGGYTLMFFAGSLVGIPARGVRRISYPVLAESWKKNDLDNIANVYKRSVQSHAVVGVFLFVMGWALIGPALSLDARYMEYASGVFVYFFIGLAQLIDMMSGVNAEILATSAKYKLNVYFNLGLAGLLVLFNLFFIEEWGITGAAAASALAMLIVNGVRWFYLKRKYDLQPFSLDVVKVLLIGGVLLCLVSFITIPLGAIPLLLVYFFSITIVYWGIIFRLNLSEDIKEWVLKMKRKFFG